RSDQRLTPLILRTSVWHLLWRALSLGHEPGILRMHWMFFSEVVLISKDERRAQFIRANTRTAFAGIVISAEVGIPCIAPPSAKTRPPFPATIWLTQLS